MFNVLVVWYLNALPIERCIDEAIRDNCSLIRLAIAKANQTLTVSNWRRSETGMGYLIAISAFKDLKYF